MVARRRRMSSVDVAFDSTEEIIGDSFAGGGGASLGISMASGREPHFAINHSEAAIAVHAQNHPGCHHYTEDVWKVRPQAVTKGRPVGLLWASPDCKHHSRARGSKPVNKNIRSLAWVVCRWAHEVKPRVIILENVREFEEWGPVVPAWRCLGCKWRGTEGQATLARRRRHCPRCNSTRLEETKDEIPDPARKGITFKRFVGRLRSAGYQVEWKTLNAADFGAPTHRRRLFLIARRDGLPIAWPEPTHADPKEIGEPTLFAEPRQPWRTAAECIDWSLPCPSIFLSPEEAKAWGKEHHCEAPRRPLKPNTLRRIAMGIDRYVLRNPRPFIVNIERSYKEWAGQSVYDPLGTVTASPRGGKHALVMPYVVDMQRFNRARDVEEPLGTATTQGNRFNLCTPLLVPVTHHGDRRVHTPNEPAPTITGAHRGELALIALTLIQSGYGERAGQAPRVLDIEAPLGTVVAGAAKHALVTAFLAKHFGGVVGHLPDQPIGTITSVDHHSVVAANFIHLNRGDKASSGADEPMRTIVSQGNHAALVYSFLMKYHSSGGQWQNPAEPLHTIDANDRFGLVVVWVAGGPYIIIDIGMRMLTPRELARCQGFPDSYLLPSDPLPGSKSSAVSMIGNSVSPLVAKALVAANYAPHAATVAC